MNTSTGEWKDLVTKRDTLHDPHEWRYYDTETIIRPRVILEDVICIHPDLMFNFWHERVW